MERLTKPELRQLFLSKRKVLSDKVLKDKIIVDKFINSLDYNKAKKIFCYVSSQYEVNTIELIKRCFTENKTVCVPRCLNKNGDMNFYIINSQSDLKPGMYGIMEPDENCEVCYPSDGDVIIMPGICFDRSGYRIGYGKGYYDKFLNCRNMLKIGFCYAECLIDYVPRDKYDIPADVVITD